MSDLLDEELEFRGGTLQLSSDHANAAESGRTLQSNVHPPSVLSGADSLTSSASSFAGLYKYSIPAAFSNSMNIRRNILPRQVLT